eukprot:11162084-Lingulodinium_polyedra.AAC.1
MRSESTDQIVPFGLGERNGIPHLVAADRGLVNSLNIELGGVYPKRSFYWTTIAFVGRWSRSVASVIKAIGVSL